MSAPVTVPPKVPVKDAPPARLVIENAEFVELIRNRQTGALVLLVNGEACVLIRKVDRVNTHVL